MSHTYRHVPVFGGKSNNKFKRLSNRRLRRVSRNLLQTAKRDGVSMLPLLRELTNLRDAHSHKTMSDDDDSTDSRLQRK
jgi:hypothetical protein